MRKLAWAAAGFSAAVFAACYLLPKSWTLYGAGMLAAIGLLGLLFRGNRRLRVVLTAGFAVLGLLWTQAHYAWLIAPAQELDGLETTAVLRVTEFPQSYTDYTAVSARLTTEGLPETTVKLYAYEEGAEALAPGDLIRASVRFRSATERYDEEIWGYTSKGVFLTGSLLETPEVTGRWGGRFLYFPQYLARMVKAQTAKLFPADVSPLMCALLTGDRTALYEDTGLTVSMSEAGLMHIVAVSGMHVAFLVGFVRNFTGRRRRTAAICIPLILVFIPMAGGSPSVVHAGFMQILLLAAPLLKRENDSITSLMAVLAILLAVNPQSARSASLQLSFAAMAGILLVTPRVYTALTAWVTRRGWMENRWIARVLRFVCNSLASTLGALLFSVPIVAAVFGYVSLVSPLTNLLCLGVLSLCFSLGYLACILGAVLPFLGTALGWVLAWGLRYAMVVVQGLGSWRFAAVYTENPLVGLWLCAGYVLLALCWFLRDKRGFRPAIPACTVLCLLLAVIAATKLADSREALTVTALDVGQGQSLVFLCGENTVMIDCGGPESAGAGGIAADYVESHFRSRVDVLILTHLHADHANGVEELLCRVKVGTLILPAEDADEDGVLPGIQAAAARMGTEIVRLDTDSVLALDRLELDLYAPIGKGSLNERGLLITLRCGDFDMLVTGDADAATERRLLAKTQLPQMDLLIVGHHGSKNSTSAELLARTEPEMAIISVGGNSYGHPTEETLRRLADAGTAVYRTDHSGSITLRVHK